MKQKFTLMVLLITAGSGLFAQFLSPKKPPLIGIQFTLVDNYSPQQIDSSSLSKVWKQGDIYNLGEMAPAFTVSYWKGLSNNFDISGKLNGIFYDYARKNDRVTSRTEFGAELQADINFHPISDAHLFTPFINLGIGMGHYTDKFSPFIPVGLGFQFNFNSQLYLIYQSQYRHSLKKEETKSSLAHSFGVAFNIGRDRPAEPVQVPVPIVTDRDNDGVPDSLDACPDTLGLAALNGCPDKDGDGIADKDDTCPDVAGTAKYQGCPVPDTDKDGINDEEDKCPNVPGVARYQGCPIPDTDGDGVNDEEDKCPNEAGVATNFGCPEIKPEVIEKVNLAARNVFFATGSAKLLAKSFPALKGVAQILEDNPTYKIDVEGHTDSTGGYDMNMALSDKRAGSVAEYLKTNGVDESRIASKGFGPDMPKALNKTAAGRAKNRRVEMKLRNY